ncbi:MAG: PKD domain-containing protein, partial [Cytophagales bacterium]|nr:PKD domain-containing protein [Cytophagales bacterium]
LPNFSTQATACINERLILQSSSAPTDDLQWDFCANQLEGAYASANRGTISIFLTNISIAKDNNQWYGFAVSRTNQLFRIDFGDNPVNTPSATVSLGNPNNAINSPEGIDVIKEGDNWYGLITNQGNDITRVSWGTSLVDMPTAVKLNLNSFNKLQGPIEIEIVKQAEQYIAVVANGFGNYLTLINFGNSLSNNPTDVDMITSPVFPGATNMYGVAAVRVCEVWTLFSVASSKVYKVDIGEELFKPILPSQVKDFTSDVPFEIGSFNHIRAAVEVTDVHIFLSSYTGRYLQSMIWRNGAEHALFNDLNLPVLGYSPYGFNIYNNHGQYGLLLTGYDAGSMSHISVTSPCNANIRFSTQLNPEVYFSQSGENFISLSIRNAEDILCSSGTPIVISTAVAPDLSLVTNGVQCVDTDIQFTAKSNVGGIQTYSWDFDDNGTSSLQDPSHQYGNAGSYNVKLHVAATNGCQNFNVKTIKIYDSPSASFASPSGLICTNNQFTFANNTVDNFDGNLSYQWYVDNTPFATTRDFSYAFSTTGSKEVKLKTSIPGCSSEQTQTVSNVLPGPVVDFTITGKCENENILFANNSSGSVTGYLWNFGNSQTSTLLNPTQNYSKGNYTVSLQATAPNGCISSTAKNLTIYSKPQPDFSIGLPPFSCAGTASQFTDQTAAPTDSNIATWTWGFGDAANGSSLVKNPSYTYATANTYNVSLAVATNFGCTNTIQKSVTISPSPVAGFSNLPACVNQTTQFTDTSSGSIKSRLWQIQSNTFSTASPQYTFPASGSFPVVLTVTGNNNCVSQASKNIVVPIVPSLDFSVQAPCADSPTVFTELTTSVDPSISKSWSFGSQGTGNGSPAQYAFSSTGTYVVRLNSTRQSGCIYSVSKNVTIISPPVADFVPSIDAGAAPLPVSFTNNSSGANSYLWKFGDPGNSTSVLVSPTFVFSELGAYNVELSASNSVGCTNRISKPISVVIPKVDAEMTDFFFVKDTKTGSLQPVVKLLNRSNITLTNPIILLDVAGGSGVSQQITGTIKPNQEISQMLDLKLVPKTNQYVCAEVVVVGDMDTFLNRKCLSLSGEEVLFTPFPNPAREQLNMDWISIDGSAVTFQVLTSAGAVSFQQTISSINSGLNRLIINTSALLPGIYFIRFSDSKTDRTFSFAVTGN